VDEQPAHVVEPLEREAALVEDRGALERRHTAGDDAKRLAGGVVIRGLDSQNRPPRTDVRLRPGRALPGRALAAQSF
jgi:hypothetical protein